MLGCWSNRTGISITRKAEGNIKDLIRSPVAPCSWKIVFRASTSSSQTVISLQTQTNHFFSKMCGRTAQTGAAVRAAAELLNVQLPPQNNGPGKRPSRFQHERMKTRIG